MNSSSPAVRRLLVRLSDQLREVVDPADVYYAEALGGRTVLRRATAGELVDVRSLGELMPTLEAHGFFRIHRSFAVHLGRIRQLRRREEGRDWEAKLEPPVDRVLPISREAWPELVAALEG